MKPDYARIRADHARLAGQAVPPAAAGPCQYLGAERVRVAGSNRDWRRCEHPAAPQGNPVCRCQGCGPTCVGYSPEDTAEDR